VGGGPRRARRGSSPARSRPCCRRWRLPTSGSSAGHRRGGAAPPVPHPQGSGRGLGRLGALPAPGRPLPDGSSHRRPSSRPSPEARSRRTPHRSGVPSAHGT
jgi:hypothetical protein